MIKEEVIKPTFSKPVSDQGKGFETQFKKTMASNAPNVKLNEMDGMLSEVEQSLKKKIFSLAKMEALVFSDPKLTAVYNEMAENGEEKYGYHYNETIQNMIFNDYVLNSPKYLQKYKMAVPKKKKRRDKSGINQLKKSGEETMKKTNPVFKPKKPELEEGGEPVTKVQFLVNEKDPKNPDVFAYFPEDIHNGEYRTAYSHVGQHSSAHPQYAAESRPARPEEYQDLKAELEGIGYNLEVVNGVQETTGAAGSSGAFVGKLREEDVISSIMKGQHQPDEEDCFIESNGWKYSVSCGHKFIGEFNEMDDALNAVKNWKQSNKFFPNTWFISDHGNVSLIDDEGNILQETTTSASSGAYVGPAAWGGGDLMKGGKSKAMRKPIWKGGTIIQETNYLIDPRGFRKYVKTLNEQSDADYISSGSDAYGNVNNMSPENQKVIKNDMQTRKWDEPNLKGSVAEGISPDMYSTKEDLKHLVDITKQRTGKGLTKDHIPMLAGEALHIIAIQMANKYLASKGLPVDWEELPDTNSMWNYIDENGGMRFQDLQVAVKEAVDDRISEGGFGEMGDMFGGMDESKSINEKAKSPAQQRLFGMAHAAQKGEMPMSKLGGAAKKIAQTVNPEDVEDFASTKHNEMEENITNINEDPTTMANAAKQQPKEDSMSNKMDTTIPIGTQATGGMNESDMKLLEEINNELNAYSIHHNKLKKMAEDRKPSALVLRDRVGSENETNFKKDLQHSGTKEIIDVEKELMWKDQQTDVPEDPQKLGLDIEKKEIKVTDAEGDEALKNVGDSANDKGDEIPKRNLSKAEQDEVNLYRKGQQSLVYDNEPGKRFEDRMKADMGEKMIDIRNKQMANIGKQPMYNKDTQPVDDGIDKVQFDKEKSGWNERKGIEESMITGRYHDALNKRRLIDFTLNEVLIADKNTNLVEEYCYELDFTGLGNSYVSKTIDNKVIVNEGMSRVLESYKFYTNGKDVIGVKNPVQSLNENDQKAKPVVNEQVDKMKHLLGYKPNKFVDTNNTKKNRGF